jgi:DTW domain-containing protein YfiP
MTRCARCSLHDSACICGEVPVVATRTRILIVRHAAETAKPSNSGRLAALALSNSALCNYGARDTPFDATPLRAPRTWVLFGDGDSTSTPAGDPPAQLVVLDGTWTQARRMYQRIDALRGLPQLALPALAASPDQLRTPPRPGALSTIQAIARAVELLEGPDVAAPLDELYRLMIERSRATARRRP